MNRFFRNLDTRCLQLGCMFVNKSRISTLPACISIKAFSPKTTSSSIFTCPLRSPRPPAPRRQWRSRKMPVPPGNPHESMLHLPQQDLHPARPDPAVVNPVLGRLSSLLGMLAQDGVHRLGQRPGGSRGDSLDWGRRTYSSSPDRSGMETECRNRTRLGSRPWSASGPVSPGGAFGACPGASRRVGR